jgi:hypothetical protein
LCLSIQRRLLKYAESQEKMTVCRFYAKHNMPIQKELWLHLYTVGNASAASVEPAGADLKKYVADKRNS